MTATIALDIACTHVEPISQHRPSLSFLGGPLGCIFRFKLQASSINLIPLSRRISSSC